MSGWTGWLGFGSPAPLEPLLQTEGFAAIQNLTLPDSTFILPVLIGLLSITNIEASHVSRNS